MGLPISLAGSSSRWASVYHGYTCVFIHAYIITSPKSTLKKIQLTSCLLPNSKRMTVELGYFRALRVSRLQEVVISQHLWLCTVLASSSKATRGDSERQNVDCILRTIKVSNVAGRYFVGCPGALLPPPTWLSWSPKTSVRALRHSWAITTLSSPTSPENPPELHSSATWLELLQAQVVNMLQKNRAEKTRMVKSCRVTLVDPFEVTSLHLVFCRGLPLLQLS